MRTQSWVRLSWCACAVLEYSAVNCQPSCSLCSTGSQASCDGLKRVGAIIGRLPAAAWSRYWRSMASSSLTEGAFECLERVDVQFLVDALGEAVAQSRHDGEQLDGIGGAAQPLELRPVSRA